MAFRLRYEKIGEIGMKKLMSKRFLSKRIISAIIAAAVVLLMVPTLFILVNADIGVGSATVTQREAEFSNWQINGGGTATQPHYYVNKTWTMNSLALTAAAPSQAALAQNETANVDLTTALNTSFTNSATNDTFTLTFSARTRSKETSNITISSVDYKFTNTATGAVVNTSRSFDLKMKRFGDNTVSPNATFNIMQLGLTPGTWTVVFYVHNSKSGHWSSDDGGGTFATIVIPEPAVNELNKPNFLTFNYSVSPVNGYDPFVGGGVDPTQRTAEILRTANADSTNDSFTATVSGVNQTDGKTYTGTANFTLSGVRENKYTFVADSTKLAQAIPAGQASQTVRTGASFTVPSLQPAKGWLFAGWNPAVGGSLTADGSDHTYTAQFQQDANGNGVADDTETKYGVTYADGADNEEIAVPSAAANLLSGLDYTIPNTVPKRADNVFTCWKLDDATSYKPGDTIKMPEKNLTLTAVWTPDINNNGKADSEETKYTVTFADGVADADITVPAAIQNCLADVSYTIPNDVPKRKDYVFTAWKLNGTTTYQPGASIKMPLNDLALTAVWAVDINNNGKPDDEDAKYTISFADGVADADIAVPALIQNCLSDVNYTIPNDVPKRGDYVFAGWKLNDTTTYKPGDSIKMPENHVALTAVWAADANNNGKADDEETKYTVTYADGVADADLIVPQEATNRLSGLSYTIPTTASAKRPGYVFAGWKLDDTTYMPGDSFKMPANNVTLTAAWDKDVLPPVLTVPGDTTINVFTAFDPMEGVSAVDQNDGSLTDKVICTGSVNIALNGKYRLVYTVSDAGGNQDAAIRIITVTGGPVDGLTLTDEPTGLTVNGTLPEGSSLTVQQLTQGDSYSATMNGLQEVADPSQLNSMVYDVAIMQNNKMVTLTEKGLNASIPLPGNFDAASTMVYQLVEVREAAANSVKVATSSTASQPAEPNKPTYKLEKLNSSVAGNCVAFNMNQLGVILLTSNFQPKYTVTFEDGVAGESITVPQKSAELLAGSNFTIPSTVLKRTGYQFAGWKNSSGKTYLPGESFKMPEENVVLTAVWVVNGSDSSTSSDNSSSSSSSSTSSDNSSGSTSSDNTQTYSSTSSAPTSSTPSATNAAQNASTISIADERTPAAVAAESEQTQALVTIPDEPNPLTGPFSIAAMAAVLLVSGGAVVVLSTKKRKK